MNPISLRVTVDDVEIDLAALPVRSLERTLDMRSGLLFRRAVVRLLPALDADVRNLDSNYDETFWNFTIDYRNRRLAWRSIKKR